MHFPINLDHKIWYDSVKVLELCIFLSMAPINVPGNSERKVGPNCWFWSWRTADWGERRKHGETALEMIDGVWVFRMIWVWVWTVNLCIRAVLLVVLLELTKRGTKWASSCEHILYKRKRLPTARQWDNEQVSKKGSDAWWAELLFWMLSKSTYLHKRNFPEKFYIFSELLSI